MLLASRKLMGVSKVLSEYASYSSDSRVVKNQKMSESFLFSEPRGLRKLILPSYSIGYCQCKCWLSNWIVRGALFWYCNCRGWRNCIMSGIRDHYSIEGSLELHKHSALLYGLDTASLREGEVQRIPDFSVHTYLFAAALLTIVNTSSTTAAHQRPQCHTNPCSSKSSNAIS
jgi:hypothetical protein